MREEEEGVVRGACGRGTRTGAGGGREDKGKRKRDPVANKKDLITRWKDPKRKREEGRRGAARRQGVGKEKGRGKIRVCSRVCLAGLLGPS